MVQLKKLPAVFYRTAAGNEPVREWLKELNQSDRRIVGGKILRLLSSDGRSVCRSAAR